MKNESVRVRVGAMIVSTIILGGCLASDYTPPLSNAGRVAFDKDINRPFDEVWTDLIEFASRTFFAIEHTDRDSGLLILKYTASDTTRYVDCGHFKTSNLVDSFSGQYTRYAERNLSAELSGGMNIFVRETAEGVTNIRVNARYVYKVGNYQIGINTWTFQSGSDATVRVSGAAYGTQPMRTCQPTYELERMVLRGVN